MITSEIGPSQSYHGICHKLSSTSSLQGRGIHGTLLQDQETFNWSGQKLKRGPHFETLQSYYPQSSLTWVFRWDAQFDLPDAVPLIRWLGIGREVSAIGALNGRLGPAMDSQGRQINKKYLDLLHICSFLTNKARWPSGNRAPFPGRHYTASRDSDFSHLRHK